MKEYKPIIEPEATVTILNDDKAEGEYIWTKGEVQAPAYRDKNFAIVFLVHLGFICISAMFAPSVAMKYDDLVNRALTNDDDYYEKFESVENNALPEKGLAIIALFIFCAQALSLALTVGALYFLQKHADRVIKVSVISTIVWFFGFGLFFASTQTDDTNSGDDNMPIAIFFFIVAAMYVCYAFSFWKDIPFAASTLTTGVTACRANLGVFSFAFVSPVLRFITVILQCMSILTLLSWVGIFEIDASGTTQFAAHVVTFFWWVSLYWTSEVIKNISTVTVSGAVGTWWYSPAEASSFCSSAVTDSFKRAITYSFGSICFGSLVVAIISAIAHLLRRAQRRCPLLYCVIACIMQYIEMLIEYFNKWAFVYVGLYGYDYKTAGKNVMGLFNGRGWSTVISHSLVQKAMFTVSLCIGLVTGLVAAVAVSMLELIADGDGDGAASTAVAWLAFFIPFFIAVNISSTLMSVVSTACDTTIVCFAEGPNEFEQNHPLLHAKMQETFLNTYPDVNCLGRGTEVV